ncbi:MAG: SusD/RagB family nutrient-binding outer membrane lipoprotein [Bacteroidales bacterium]|nr:SusD/RagB family nutrient-binding outer membrane lipoprotein [Bacteroidales bacterium]
MKLTKAILLGAVSLFTLASCGEWLDVNTDPENPSSESATYQTRLAHIEFYTNSATQFANWRTGMSIGDWTRNYSGGNYWNISYWNMPIGAVTTPYQWWFVGAANNISYMYDKAMAAGATDYAGVAKIIWAYGNMLMTDIYGEMPFSEACGEDATPSYDTGKEIWLGCVKSLEEGLELLAQGQDSSLPSLSVGDWWCGGDTDKWIKFGNLLKARWLVKLSKKSSGDYLDCKYDEDEILAALAKGPQSIDDDAWIQHTDDNSSSHDVLGWDEPVDYSPLYSVCGMNSGYMVTEMLYNNLTDFDGQGVEDPRADLIIPWAYATANSAAISGVKFDGHWRRSLGVDMTSSSAPNLTAGPLRASWNATKHFYIDSDNSERLGDTVYVECTSTSTGYAAAPDLFYRRGGNSYDESRESGSFYSRVSSPTYLGTYAEACFIKAEVLFNSGNKSGAYDAYVAGVQASMERMNTAIEYWVSGDADLADCPSFQKITDTEISDYISNALGTSSNLTLGKIMTQKRIAMHFSVENWNDMRRYDYNPDVFLGFAEPAYHAVNATALLTIPAGTQPRRWRQCSHEFNYNSENLKAIGAKVPGADTSADNWNTEDDAWSIKVWWDSTESEWPDGYGE